MKSRLTHFLCTGVLMLASLSWAAAPEKTADSAFPGTDTCEDALLGAADLRIAFLRSFLRLHPQSFARHLLALYPELRWLTLKVVISPEDAKAVAHPDAFSPALFSGNLHPEVERTLTSLVALAQILRGDYDGFTKSQTSPSIKLKQASFDHIRSVFFRVLGRKDGGPIPLGNAALASVDLEKLDALMTYMVIHDLGKSKRFEKVASKVSGEITVDHDRILVHGLSAEPMLSTSFERLSEHFQTLILKGMSADFNMGQFAQGENVPASLNKLFDLNEAAFDFYFLHLFLDVAGSSGVKTPHGSAMMIEPVFNGFRTGYEFLPRLYQGHSGESVYAFFLETRARMFGLPFTAGNATDYAVARLGLMSRMASAADAKLVLAAFESLDEGTRNLLVKELGVTGNGLEAAILPYYSPALIANLRAAVKGALKVASGTPSAHPALDMHRPITRVSRKTWDTLPDAVKKLRVPELESSSSPGVYCLVNDVLVAETLKEQVQASQGALTPEAADLFALRRAFELLARTYAQARPSVEFSNAKEIFTINMNALAAVVKSGLAFDDTVTQKQGILTGDGANVEMTPNPSSVSIVVK
jgi:hypothetical protein